MLITNKQFPILERLEKNSLGVIGYYQDDQTEFLALLPEIRTAWKKLTPFFKERVRIISEPFHQAYNLAKAKLNSPEFYENVESQVGTLIHGDITKCYTLYNCPEYLSLILFQFYGDKLVSVCELRTQEEDKNGATKYMNWFSKAVWPNQDRNTLMHYATGELLLMLNFFKYAEVETKILPANKKVQDINCKYVNQTNTKVEYVNSTWFTNLVKSDGFKVRGHFRLQAHGTGLKERKLIWIADFEKTGYTAPARKTAEHPQ